MAWIISLFILAFMVAPSLLANRIYSRWPMKHIERSAEPAKFWFVIGLWSLVALIAAIVGIVGLFR